MKPHIKPVLFIILTTIAIMRLPTVGSAQTSPTESDLMKSVPKDFTVFSIPTDTKATHALNRYLWYHCQNRMGNGRTMFNKEYLTLGDLWLNSFEDKRRKSSIQDVHRADLLDIAQDSEGYISTHQSSFYAHDMGWPFPYWIHATRKPSDSVGHTAGWMFQNEADLNPTVRFLVDWKMTQFYGEPAIAGWELHNLKSLGITDKKWQLQSTGDSPSITTPKGVEIDAFQAPFLQLRWVRKGEPKTHAVPYVEWMREGDTNFSPERRVYFSYDPTNEWQPGCIWEDPSSRYTTTEPAHSIIRMYKHPQWNGKITRIRLSLCPGESGIDFAIDSFFTAYDTRQTINNPIYIFANWNYFRWTGDIAFLRANINKMRNALRYMDTELMGAKLNYIRNTMPGHDGTSGITPDKNGKSTTINGGHGLGSNYWDILSFGGDDLYATAQYYAALKTMAEVEEAINGHPEWNIPSGGNALDPTALRKHAVEVKITANKKFWDPKVGRFVGCIDINGKAHDYGYTFINLETIWYGLASDEHAHQILSWISGKRIVAGDDSQGADIYHWRLGPRTSTKRNAEWCTFCWTDPQTIPWGYQVQDGGTVLGFTFYDLWARLRLLGADNAWTRFKEIMAWEDVVWAEGGYRAYYKNDPKRGTLQGGNTAGGIGIDWEFYESVMVPSIMTYGFMGLSPQADELVIDPKLPSACPSISADNVLYHNVRMDIGVSRKSIDVTVKNAPGSYLKFRLQGMWKREDTKETGSLFKIEKPGTYRFTKI